MPESSWRRSACRRAAMNPTRLVQPTAATPDAVKFWATLAITRWNQQATELLRQYPPTANGQAQAATSRMLTYLSLAQYRAVLAAEARNDRGTHPSVAAA